MTESQEQLAKKHGTPREFALACGRAADQIFITDREANAAEEQYQREWDAAGYRDLMQSTDVAKP